MINGPDSHSLVRLVSLLPSVALSGVGVASCYGWYVYFLSAPGWLATLLGELWVPHPLYPLVAEEQQPSPNCSLNVYLVCNKG